MLFSLLSESEISCLDKRSTFFPSCENRTRYFDQGTCKNNYEVQHTYCAETEMTNLEVIQGETKVPYQPQAGWVEIFLYGSNQMVSAKEGTVFDCKNATVLIGQPKAEIERYNPEDGEYNIPFIVLSFKCLD